MIPDAEPHVGGFVPCWRRNLPLLFQLREEGAAVRRGVGTCGRLVAGAAAEPRAVEVGVVGVPALSCRARTQLEQEQQAQHMTHTQNKTQPGEPEEQGKKKGNEQRGEGGGEAGPFY